MLLFEMKILNQLEVAESSVVIVVDVVKNAACLCFRVEWPRGSNAVSQN